MAKHISFPHGPKSNGSIRAGTQPDERVKALVRFLARRAAEEDYARALADSDKDGKNTKH